MSAFTYHPKTWKKLQMRRIADILWKTRKNFCMEGSVRKLAEYTYPEEQQLLLVQLKDAVENLDVDTCSIMIEQWEVLL